MESSQRREILSACPGLRTFHCDIEVKGSATGVEEAGPVYLADLEELNLRRIKLEHQESILPLLLVGRKPLSLSIQTTKYSYHEVDYAKDLFSAAIMDFFKRSNVTARYIWGPSPPGSLLKCLFMDSPASVRILGLETFILQGIPGLTNLEQSCITRLDCLNLRSCYIELESIREFVRACPIRVLKLPANTEEPQILDELVAIFPVVKYVDSSASIEEWNSGEIWDWDWELP
ncbi:hypothetical protein ACGC1H_006283 [Rhizoctonia solani]